MTPLKVWGAIVSLSFLMIYIAGRVVGIWPVSDWAGALVLLTAYGALQTLSSLWASQPGIIRELPRKLMHLGNGTVWISLPWLFTNPWPPTIVAALGIIWFIVLRSGMIQRTNALALAGQVYRSRSSVGDVIFSSGFALTFHLAQQDAAMYVVAATILTFADGLAALIGACWGRLRFRTPSGFKSLEGTAACFIICWTAFLVGLSPYSPQPWTLLCMSAIFSLMLALIEIMAPLGTDNLLLPLVSWAILKAASILPPSTLMWMAGSLSIALLCCLAGLNYAMFKENHFE